MAHDLPPLSNLIAFEAAARRGSFTDAARELCRTQAAISYRVRGLEDSLDTELFVRGHRTLTLTKDGESLLRATQAAFKILEAEKALITRRPRKQIVSVSAPISFCSKWLLPRLYRFQSAHPEIGILIDANDTLVDLSGDGPQVAIRYCKKMPEEYRLLKDDVVPVCSPQVLPAGDGALSPQAIGGVTLLMDEMLDHKWSRPDSAIAQQMRKRSQQIHFTHTGYAIDAAIAGKGLAFGRLPLVLDDLEAGRLVRPFADIAQSDLAYHLLTVQPAKQNEAIRTVMEWLKGEAAATEDLFFRGSANHSNQI